MTGRGLIGVVFLAVMLAGCSTEFNPATMRQESVMYDSEKEKSIGASVAAQVEKTMKFNDELDINARVDRVFNKLLDVIDRHDLVYTVRIIEEDELNAFSLPGGYVYIFKGLLDKMDNDDQLAAVLAHELAHITAKHSMKRLQGAYGATILTGLAMATGDGAMVNGVSLAANAILFQNSREDEFQADTIGVRYMRDAGYNPIEMKKMLGKLLQAQAKDDIRPKGYWRTHPYLSQRIGNAGQATGQMEFRDYLNITGEEK